MTNRDPCSNWVEGGLVIKPYRISEKISTTKTNWATTNTSTKMTATTTTVTTITTMTTMDYCNGIKPIPYLPPPLYAKLSSYIDHKMISRITITPLKFTFHAQTTPTSTFQLMQPLITF